MSGCRKIGGGAPGRAVEVAVGDCLGHVMDKDGSYGSLFDGERRGVVDIGYRAGYLANAVVSPGRHIEALHRGLEYPHAFFVEPAVSFKQP